LFSEAIEFLSECRPPHAEVIASGGMGKTTALVLLWRKGISSYNPGFPVPVYIPLYSYKASSTPYIKGCLLERLRFDDKTTTVEDALRQLDCLLDTAIKGRPSVLLLLDGLNEVTGDDRLLLLEINELMKKAGVQVILTSRVQNTQLKLHNLEILPLNEYDIKRYLNSRSILYPADKALQDIITNPMMLSVYTITCKNEQKIIDANSVDELLKEYIDSLLSVHKEQTVGSGIEQQQADYAVKFLLPSIAHRMKQLKSGILTAKEVYKVVKDSYGMLTQKSFLRCFPQYIGKSKLVKNGAKTFEEWFNDAVSMILCSKFALLNHDGYGNYMLSHQNFHDYFIREYNIKSAMQNAVKRKMALPYIAASCLFITVFTFAVAKVIERIPVSYQQINRKKVSY
jgi:hypothetical protein